MKNNLGILLLLIVYQFGFGQISVATNSIVNSDDSLLGMRELKFADFDNDGDDDFIFTSPSPIDKLVWFENIDGLGTFEHHSTLTHNVYSSAINSNILDVGDIDNDNDLDVLSIGQNGDILVHENTDGLGNFVEHIIISTSTISSNAKFSDINGDGNIDIIGTELDTIYWLENLTNLNFSGANSIYMTTSGQNLQSHSIKIIDADGDMDLDIIINDSDLFWLENDEMNFSNSHILESNSVDINTMKFLDIDNDGLKDILTRDSGGIRFFKNLGGGIFDNATILINNISDFARTFDGIDMDADGDIDIVYGLYWFENTNGLGNFSSGNLISQDFDDHSDMVICNCNGDAHVDFMLKDVNQLSTPYNIAGWFLNNGSNSFLFNEIETNSHTYITGIDHSDMDNDGDIDIIIVSEFDRKIVWYENLDGQGSFGKQNIVDVLDLGYPHNVQGSDVDNDGDIDIVVSTMQVGEKIIWYENLGGNNFSSMHTIAFVEAESFYSQDIDNDGDNDIVYSSPDYIIWIENLDGQGNFSNPSILVQVENNVGYSQTTRYKTFSLEDLNSDGYMDIIYINFNDDELGWVLNLGGANFNNPIVLNSSLTEILSFATIDIDNDGDLDILSASSNSIEVGLFENIDGNATFSSIQSFSNFSNNTINASQIKSVDLDGDTFQDVLYVRSQTGFVWRKNLNGQGFSQEMPIPLESTSEDPYNSFIRGFADIDSNGSLDFITTGLSGSGANWSSNLGFSGNFIYGNVNYDLDNNGCDTNDIAISNLLLSSDNSSFVFSSFSNTNGSYSTPIFELGNYSTTIENLPDYFVSSPISQSSSFSNYGITEQIDFCLTANTIKNDINITIIPPIDEPRPGFDTSYQIVYSNFGTTQLSGDISFQFDDSKVQFLNASESIASQTANTLTIDYTDLNPFETRTIDLDFNVFPPPTTNIDDELISIVTINPTAGDETQDDNTFTLEQTVIGSYDPNDIQILEGEQVHIDDAVEYLHFLIRFQNTGTASAINVRVEHILDSKLDWTTMQLQSLSHEGRVEITDGSMVQFIFDNINLPDSTNDEPNSHGYISFKIKPVGNIVVGDIISGVADIYFDFNPPIITNTTTTEFVDNLSGENFNQNEISVYPNPTNGLLNVHSTSTFTKIQVFDMLGRLLQSQEFNQSNAQVNLSTFQDGVYFLRIESNGRTETRKIIKN